MNANPLSERDICTKHITPALRSAGWDEQTQIREEVSFTKGRIIVRGKLVSRGRGKRADYILAVKPNIRLAVIEAKDPSRSVGDGIQQALEYAEILDLPFAFASNGAGFVFHDRTGMSEPRERHLTLDQFPSPADLWQRYCAWKGLGQHRIRVNAVVPGWVMTERQKTLWAKPDAIAAHLKRQCLPDLIDPVYVARMVVFLASDDAAMCTASCYMVEAGSI